MLSLTKYLNDIGTISNVWHRRWPFWNIRKCNMKYDIIFINKSITFRIMQCRIQLCLEAHRKGTTSLRFSSYINLQRFLPPPNKQGLELVILLYKNIKKAVCVSLLVSFFLGVGWMLKLTKYLNDIGGISTVWRRRWSFWDTQKHNMKDEIIFINKSVTFRITQCRIQLCLEVHRKRFYFSWVVWYVTITFKVFYLRQTSKDLS